MGHVSALHTVLMAVMALLGAVCALAALWSGRRGDTARCWLPHLAMGTVMAAACLPSAGAVVPWAGAAALAAVAVWSARPATVGWYTCADLMACAVLLALTAWAASAAAGPTGHATPSGAAVAATVAVTLAWAGTRAALFAGTLPPPSRTTDRDPWGARLVRLGGPVMVPLMGVMVLTA
ncbi:hypothetical protein H1V43_21835 [Streptomyces sp. PSKA54]|uniref:DUF5134 domain-containing protein n=1 Tax=Streptomyces himalayensis subsp. aureolus TaxID=2758039 RepID=A0A7W2D3T5_9ACTN|nr:hypothetical protein [Streptomyces himalayensis]MBA4863950.1 hypothetical protein [Streptomyces himalayensis subsp. aureolus]